MDYIPSWITGAKTLLEKINKCIDKIEEYLTITDNHTQSIASLTTAVATNATNISNLSSDVNVLESSKQDALTPGEGISIENNVISIENNVISATGGVSGYKAKLYVHAVRFYCQNTNNEEAVIEVIYVSNISTSPSTYAELVYQYQRRINTILAADETNGSYNVFLDFEFSNDTSIVEFWGRGITNNTHDTFALDFIDGVPNTFEIQSNNTNYWYIDLEEVE